MTPSSTSAHWLSLNRLRATPAGVDVESVWQRSLRFWHVYFAAVIGLGFANVVALGLDSPRDRLGFAALLLIVLTYILGGSRTLGRRMGPMSLIYLTVLILGTFALANFWSGNGSFILFLAFAQVWAVCDSFFRGAIAVLLVGLAGFLGFWSSSGWSSLALSESSITMLVSVVFSLAMGAWITLIIQQSSERAELIRHLEQTRAELTIAHRNEGVLAERERLARDIHDTLAQGFISVITQSQAALAGLESGSADVQRAVKRLGLIEQTARDNLAEARSLVASANPASLAAASLPTALEHLVARHQEESGIAVHTTIDATINPEVGVGVVLLRVAQEALANVRRHSGATSVALGLTSENDGVRLMIQDDGQGFDPAGSAGFGISGMTARLAEIGGELILDSAIGKGTTVTAAIPSVQSSSAESR